MIEQLYLVGVERYGWHDGYFVTTKLSDEYILTTAKCATLFYTYEGAEAFIENIKDSESSLKDEIFVIYNYAFVNSTTSEHRQIENNKDRRLDPHL